LVVIRHFVVGGREIAEDRRAGAFRVVVIGVVVVDMIAGTVATQKSVGTSQVTVGLG
jgi:hypothetical protein